MAAFRFYLFYVYLSFQLHSCPTSKAKQFGRKRIYCCPGQKEFSPSFRDVVMSQVAETGYLCGLRLSNLATNAIVPSSEHYKQKTNDDTNLVVT